MEKSEKDELCISKEFSIEIQKYANLEGISTEELIEQATKDRLERLKQIYADKKPKMDFLEYNEKISAKAVRMWEEINRLEEKLSDFLLEISYEWGAYHEGAPIPPDESQEKKMPFEEYWKNVVGKVSKMSDEIRQKQDERDEFLVNFIKNYGVEKEESVEALCPNGCGTKLVKHKFIDIYNLDKTPRFQDAEEDLYCQKCGTRWIAEQHNPLKTKEAEKTESNRPIEFEQVTVKVPKLVMDFLRKTESNPVEALEFTIVDNARAEIEGRDSLEWADIFQLKPIFAAVLGDKRYS